MVLGAAIFGSIQLAAADIRWDALRYQAILIFRLFAERYCTPMSFMPAILD
ncbi:hypothetical protein GCM10011408_00920 [Dyella caseinilytica]|nr:hypothetical protein GCM10011408_00920 [Dyella caseinilytica]